MVDYSRITHFEPSNCKMVWNNKANLFLNQKIQGYTHLFFVVLHFPTRHSD